ncbi:MAG: CYTH domain-containing protein [Patescibacteria group bacterium]
MCIGSSAEWKTGVASTTITQEILEKLGFKVDVIVTKKREKHENGNVEILVDEVDGLGNFVEVEAKNKESFSRIISQLNLKEENIISSAGYPDLLKRKDAAATK